MSAAITAYKPISLFVFQGAEPTRSPGPGFTAPQPARKIDERSLREPEPPEEFARWPFDGNHFAVVDLGTTIQLDAIAEGFSRVPRDLSVADGSRIKDLYRCKIVAGRVTRTTHAPLHHPANAVSYQGIATRKYSETPAADQSNLARVVQAFAELWSIPEGTEFLVQRQGVRCTPTDGQASTVQERGGWHSDGCKKLGMLLVSRVNCEGGVSKVRDRAGFRLFSRLLAPGELLLVDDATLEHNATPIRCVDPESPGFRGIIILTITSCREP
jgi:hypothetical protein